ncbi:MAG: 2-oxoacid:acceptor oxidoreductase family protein [Acidobacteriota bacterium]|jgi:indolepyruvate ferredoxin oxidoreductase beta subunit|nr:2-oxoacid:acceptor oxidoreductase family protein [Acidobacteriota bacterium]
MNTANCLIAGVGGQGTVLAARILGAAAMAAGLDVRGSETIGMAQRGGSVTSHVRMGRDIASPLIPRGRADVILAFEPGEAARVRDYLAPGGTFLVCDRPLAPAVKGGYDGAAAARWLKARCGARVVSGEDVIRHCGARSLNIALIGAAAAAGAFPFGTDELLAALAERVNAKFLAMNIAALNYGASLFRQF